jgi:uncharacterized protein (DUF697 family)
MSSAFDLAQGDPQLIAAIRRSRRLLSHKALMAAAVGAVPIPGIDWAADATLLSRVIPQISAEFGLSVTQLDRLAPYDRERIQKAATAVGALLVGRLLTRELLITLARHAGFRMTAKQAARYVPIVGQAVSATLSYAALRALGELHIKDCVKVAQSVRHVLPPPDAPNKPRPEGPKPPSRLGGVWNRLKLR